MVSKYLSIFHNLFFLSSFLKAQAYSICCTMHWTSYKFPCDHQVRSKVPSTQQTEGHSKQFLFWNGQALLPAVPARGQLPWCLRVLLDLFLRLLPFHSLMVITLHAEAGYHSCFLPHDYSTLAKYQTALNQQKQNTFWSNCFVLLLLLLSFILALTTHCILQKCFCLKSLFLPKL